MSSPLPKKQDSKLRTYDFPVKAECSASLRRADRKACPTRFYSAGLLGATGTEPGRAAAHSGGSLAKPPDSGPGARPGATKPDVVVSVVRVVPATEPQEGNPIRSAADRRLAGMEPQAQTGQVFHNRLAGIPQLPLVVPEQNEIIHVGDRAGLPCSDAVSRVHSLLPRNPPDKNRSNRSGAQAGGGHGRALSAAEGESGGWCFASGSDTVERTSTRNRSPWSKTV